MIRLLWLNWSSTHETQRNDEGASRAFRLADLANMYDRRMQKLSVDSKPIHRTILKEILKYQIFKFIQKEETCCWFLKKDVGPAIALVCSYDDTMLMTKTAELMRTQIKEHKSKFSGSFSADNF